MSGDDSRKTFDPLRDFSGVLMQQGRVQLDADWNELVGIISRRLRAETTDIIGRGTVPKETPDGFKIEISGGTLTIGRGRIYVDGLLAENHGKSPLEFDPVLAEQRGTLAVPYDEQPYFPNAATVAPAPTEGGPHLVYLDVWQREVTYLQVPELIEKAVGMDTTTRLQTVWQVRVLANVGTDVTCDTPDDQVLDWPDIIRPSNGRLSTDAVGVVTPDDPCVIPPTGGYRGLENRLYRVEIHDGGEAGTATFKWSRDNASIATSVTAITALDKLTVARVGRDNTLRFSVGDWIEITDDFLEFAQQPGLMRQIQDVDDATQIITITAALPAGTFPTDAQGNTDPMRHTRITRWDQKGKVTDTNNNLLVDLDAPGSTGLIPVPAQGASIILEDGVQITFDTPANGTYRVGDFWCFAARTADASVEKLVEAPPRGIHHHYCRLAVVTFPNPPTDCRHLWPPPFGEAGCDCSVCVTAESHNSGILTLQSAVNQVAVTGGKICLGPGIYLITSPVIITKGSNIEISGHGLPNLIASGLTSHQPIFQIDGCVDINVEDIAFAGPVSGVAISNSLFTRIKRCLFTTEGGSSPMFLGVGLSGFVWNAQIYDCLFNNVQIAIGGPTAEAEPETFVVHSSVRGNEMFCTVAGFGLDNPKVAPQLFEFLFADNLVTAPLGFHFGGEGLDIAIERNSFMLASPARILITLNAAIVCAGSEVRISNNQIVGDRENPGLDGIVLAGHVMYGTQVKGNRINNLAGNGILVKKPTVLLETIISENQLLALGGSGIGMENGSFTTDLNISDNSMAFLGLRNQTDAMGGILSLGTALNVHINDNAIEGVGPAIPNVFEAGIVLMSVADVHIAGNRIIDIDPAGQAQEGGGIVAGITLGRLDIIDNEVRRATVPPAKPITSEWSALVLFGVLGATNIRGNVLESFGSTPTVLLGLAPSCIFTDNQCFLDNVISANLPMVGVQLGLDAKVNAGAIMASNNFVQTSPGAGIAREPRPVMVLNPEDKDKTLTVLGNITSGDILVGTTVLTGPWVPLNVQNI
jgi:hypothetical protein